MLLDLRSLFEDTGDVVIAPPASGYEPARARARRRPAVVVHTDTGLLVSAGTVLAATFGGRTVRSARGVLVAADALAGADTFRAAARWRDGSILAADGGDLACTVGFVCGHVAISQADDDDLVLGNL